MRNTQINNMVGHYGLILFLFKGYVTSKSSWRHETRAGMNSFRSPYKPRILHTRVWRHEISCRHNFMLVLKTGMKFHAGLKNMCNHQFLFHAGMKEKNVPIMSPKYDSQSVFVLWLLFYDGDDMSIFHWFVYFLVKSGEMRKKMASKKKWVYCFFFFFSFLESFFER